MRFVFLREQRLSENLKRNPSSLEDLKFVLGTISDIRAMSLTVEMRLADIQEKYRTLAMYKVEVILYVPTPPIRLYMWFLTMLKVNLFSCRVT